jgi:hypothetical protein
MPRLEKLGITPTQNGSITKELPCHEETKGDLSSHNLVT